MVNNNKSDGDLQTSANSPTQSEEMTALLPTSSINPDSEPVGIISCNEV